MNGEIIFLGTSSTMPTKERNHTSIFLRHGSERMLFDCGEGTQRQMAIAKLSAVKVGRIFITHLDGDHFLGLPGLIQTCCMRKREEPLYIYGPTGVTEGVNHAVKLSPFDLVFELVVKEIEDGVAADTEGFTVKAFPVSHRPHSIGYSFVEKATTNINEAALRRLGINPSPLYGRLKSGQEVEWKGKKISPDSYVSKAKGVKIVFSGDTEYCPRVVEEAEGADILIHEATFANELAERARETKHSTGKDAGVVAREANVKMLVLTHFSTRYKESDIPAIYDDAREEFENVVVAKDFMSLDI